MKVSEKAGFVFICVICLAIMSLTVIVFSTGNGSNLESVSVRSYSENPPGPDFIVSTNPAFVTLDPLSQGLSNITVTSIAGFKGTISLVRSTSLAGYSPYPSGSFAQLGRNNLTLAADSSNSTTLAFTPAGVRTFIVNVTGTSGGLTHSALVVFQVVTFQLSINSNAVGTLAPGSSGVATLTVESLNGFSGIVRFNATVNPMSGLTLALSSTNVTDMGSVSLRVTAASWASGTHRIDVDARSGKRDWSDFILVTVGTQPSSSTTPPPELFLFGLPATVVTVASWLLTVIYMVRQTLRKNPEDLKMSTTGAR